MRLGVVSAEGQRYKQKSKAAKAIVTFPTLSVITNTSMSSLRQNATLSHLCAKLQHRPITSLTYLCASSFARSHIPMHLQIWSVVKLHTIAHCFVPLGVRAHLAKQPPAPDEVDAEPVHQTGEAFVRLPREGPLTCSA